MQVLWDCNITSITKYELIFSENNMISCLALQIMITGRLYALSFVIIFVSDKHRLKICFVIRPEKADKCQSAPLTWCQVMNSQSAHWTRNEMYSCEQQTGGYKMEVLSKRTRDDTEMPMLHCSKVIQWEVRLKGKPALRHDLGISHLYFGPVGVSGLFWNWNTHD